ncbi:MAG: endonuclease/exonuclease/phosphatase family protein [Clostridia bacterium]|nr:endonuclease/exonuclease/phosphatase family protein [Clostridia bacterium]
MKKLFFVAMITIMVMISLTFVSCKEEAKEDNTIVIMSYNIKITSLLDIDNNELALINRYPRLKDKIDSYSPDIFGMQEAGERHMEYFAADYSDVYDYVVTYRTDSSVLFTVAESTPIFYKKAKFELLDSGTFWLSATPDIMSKGWDANNYRVCTYVQLKLKATGQVFYVYNTHLDFGQISVPESVALIKARMNLEYPCILIGDFNFTPVTSYYTSITEHLEDSRLVAPITMPDTSTINGFSNNYQGKVIDYCFLSKGNFEVSKYEVSNNDIEEYGSYASDHFAVIAYITIKE